MSRRALRIKSAGLSWLVVLLLLGPGCQHCANDEPSSLWTTVSSREQRLARHSVVGFSSWAEAQRLIESYDLAGLYLTRRNVSAHSTTEVRAAIDALQKMRRQQGRDPLLICADQEGGVVSHLSPPLPPMGSLQELIFAGEVRGLHERVQAFASEQAVMLAGLGVNCNLAPVLDLQVPHKRPQEDQHSWIHARAIAADPELASRVGVLYADVLAEQGLLPVAKHFPGLGNVQQDTHSEAGLLLRSASLLWQEDWRPFAAFAGRSDVGIMVGHVLVRELDPERLASASAVLIEGVLRGQMGFRGLVFTDDLCMGAVGQDEEVVAQAGLASLEAGADLLLVAWYPERFEPALRRMAQNTFPEDFEPILLASLQRLVRVSAQSR